MNKNEVIMSLSLSFPANSLSADTQMQYLSEALSAFHYRFSIGTENIFLWVILSYSSDFPNHLTKEKKHSIGFYEEIKPIALVK